MSTNVSTPSTDTDMIPRFGPVDANNRTTEPSKVTSNDAPVATDVADEPPERCGDDDNHQPDENTNPTSVFSNRTAGTTFSTSTASKSAYVPLEAAFAVPVFTTFNVCAPADNPTCSNTTS